MASAEERILSLVGIKTDDDEFIKKKDVLQILNEQNAKWRELRELIEKRVRWVRINPYRKAGVDDVIRSYEDCFEKIEEKLKELQPK